MYITVVAPTKTLCHEIYQSWNRKFGRLGISVAMATAESIPEIMSDLGHIEPFNIIVATPEKWDLLTREWTKFKQIVQSIRLFCIDDIDLIDDVTRGPTLETIIMRSKYFQTDIRYMAASATLFNINDFAKWFYTLNPNHTAEAVR